MNMVFQKTRELGDALMNSEEYQKLKQAEAAVSENEEATRLMAEHANHRKTLERLLEAEDPDLDELNAHSETLESAEQRLMMMDCISELNEARKSFSDLVAQINQVLRFIVTGSMDDEEQEGGCAGGNCGGCSGCGSKMLN